MRISSITALLVSALSIAAESARAANPVHVRVIVQVVEVPHAALTKWTTGETLPGREIHERAMKLAEAGEAQIVETCVLIVRSGERAIAESIAELIYPTEYEPSSLPNALPPGAMDGNFPAIRYLRPSDVLSTSFETRNTGSTLEIEPMIGHGGKVIDLRVSLDLVERASLVTFTEFRDQWGDGSSRMPIFGARRMTSSMTLTSGVFDLWNVFTPKPAAVPAAATRQLVFVRADLVPILANP